MGTRKVKHEKEPQLTTAECIRRLFVADGTEASLGTEACIRWAHSRHYVILRTHEDATEGEREALKVIDDWRKAMALQALWESRGLTNDVQRHLENEEDREAVTIGELHGFLTRLLVLHPDVAAIPVAHHECCGVVETTDIVFNVEKERLELS